MSESLGILQTLEVLIKDAKKVPLSKKVMIEQDMALELIEKLSFVIKRQEVEMAAHLNPQSVTPDALAYNPAKDSAVQMVLDAKKESQDIRQEASRYADNVLSRLQLLVTKMQKNMVRLEENIKHGRLTLDETLSTEEDSQNEQSTIRQEVLQSETTPPA